MATIMFEGVVMDPVDGWTGAFVIPAQTLAHAVAGMDRETQVDGLYAGCVYVVADPFDE